MPAHKKYATEEERKAAVREQQRRYNQANRAKHQARQRELRAANPDHYKELGRRKKLRLYGLSQLEYDTLVVRQSGCCAICGRDDVERLCVDHDHSTLRVRALLCKPCNAMLGMVREDIQILNRAIAYLESHK